MSVSIHSGGATHAASISFRDASNSLQRVAVGMIRNAANALKLFTSSISAALSTPSVGGGVNTGLSVTIQTSPVTVTPDGGSGTYTYLWSVVSTSSGTWSINSATSATTTFTGGSAGPGDVFTATFHCVVTDSVGNTVTTSNVVATVHNIGFNVSGGGGPLP